MAPISKDTPAGSQKLGFFGVRTTNNIGLCFLNAGEENVVVNQVLSHG